MHLTLAGWLLVAAPILFCAGVWFGRRLEREQQTMNREASTVKLWDPEATLAQLAADMPAWGHVDVSAGPWGQR